jgi:hypothetical protein
MEAWRARNYSHRVAERVTWLGLSLKSLFRSPELGNFVVEKPTYRYYAVPGLANGVCADVAGNRFVHCKPYLRDLSSRSPRQLRTTFL